MHAHLEKGALLLRLGRRFGVRDAERLRETILSFSPLSRLTLDFSELGDVQDPALGMLGRTLGALRAVPVVLLGVTFRQFRVLSCLGAA